MRQDRKKEKNRDISPEDILIDQLNLPSFDHSQLEGRIIKPISNYIFYIIIFFVLAVFFHLSADRCCSWHRYYCI